MYNSAKESLFFLFQNSLILLSDITIELLIKNMIMKQANIPIKMWKVPDEFGLGGYLNY